MTEEPQGNEAVRPSPLKHPESLQDSEQKRVPFRMTPPWNASFGFTSKSQA